MNYPSYTQKILPKKILRFSCKNVKKFLYYFIISFSMSIEEILISAEEHGKRFDVFKEVQKIKESNPGLPIEELYDKAYQTVMKV